jgi:hypothetical protein
MNFTEVSKFSCSSKHVGESLPSKTENHFGNTPIYMVHNIE